jgi:hypothetical protein
MIRHRCPIHGPTVPRARGVRFGEVLGVLVITFLTCGLGGVLALGLIPLARRQVCPLCSTPTIPETRPPELPQGPGEPSA